MNIGISSGRRLKVVIVNRSDRTGGAAVVSFRLMEALRAAGVDARMLVVEKLSDSPYVETVASPLAVKIPFVAERLGIFLADGLDRGNLFKIDNGAWGLPLWHHPLIEDADVVCLNWINQGMLSLKGIRRIGDMGKPIVWTMHDMWNLTGICHHAGTCARWLMACGDCPLLGRLAFSGDMSHSVFCRKERLYRRLKGEDATHPGIAFVAVSSWLSDLGRRSPLLRDMPVEVIPNAFPVDDFPAPDTVDDWRREVSTKEFTVTIGAARLDDSVKGLPLLVEATRHLRETDPVLASRTRLVTFGGLKDPHALDNLAVAHTHLGPVAGRARIREIFRRASVVVSSSLYETLPGTLIEGMACGAVPVAFDRGGQVDIVDHKTTGYLAHITDDPEESARNLAEGLVWAASCGVSGSLTAESVRKRFSADSVAARYIRLFRRLTAK